MDDASAQDDGRSGWREGEAAVRIDLGFWPDQDAVGDDARRADVIAQARAWADAEPLWDLGAVVDVYPQDPEQPRRGWIVLVDLVPAQGTLGL